MSLKYTKTEMFAAIWPYLYSKLGNVHMSDGLICSERNLTTRICIIPAKEYDYVNDFKIGDTVHVGTFNVGAQTRCMRGVIESQQVPGWFDVRIGEDGDRSFINHARPDKIARDPADFESTWAIHLCNIDKFYDDLFTDVKWQKKFPERNRREMTIYPRDLSEMEEAIAHIASVIN